MLDNLITSIIRTAVPYLTVWIISFFALPDAMSAHLESALILIVGTIWYVVARTVEQKFPEFGWVLGSPSKPVYGDSDK